MNHNLRIRGGHAQDANRLAVLARQVWLHTYATEGITDEIAQYVLAEFTPEKYVAALQEPATHLMVAEQGGSLVGFAAMQFGVSCPTGAHAVVELQTLYVDGHFMGRGVGKALLQAAQAKALADACSALWLTVNAQNARAIAFYGRQGYARVGSVDFVLGETRHENHVLIGRNA